MRTCLVSALALLILVSAMCLIGPLLPITCAPKPRTPVPVEPELIAGVRVGAGIYERTDFELAHGTGEVVFLALGRVARDPQEHLIVVGQSGFEVRDLSTLALLGGCGWSRHHEFISAVDLDGDGALEFATLGESREPAAVYDGNGNELACDSSDGPVSLSAPVRIGWERSHFHVLGVDGSERRVEPPGKPTLTSDGATRLADTDGDGAPEIVRIDGKKVHVHSITGAVRSSLAPPDGGYVNRLDLCAEFGSPPRPLLIVGHNVFDGPRAGQHYELYELDARTRVGEVSWEQLRARRGARALGGEPSRSVRLSRLAQQAAVAGISHTRQQLTVTDPDERAVFEEIVAAPGGAYCSTEGAIEPLPEPSGAFVAAYGRGLRLYVPMTVR